MKYVIIKQNFNLEHLQKNNMDGKIMTAFNAAYKNVHVCMCHIRTHHLSDHHDVRSGLLVDSQDIQEPHVPEDDIETIHRPPGDEGNTSTQPQAKANKEGHNGQKVRHIEIVTEPHLYLLAYFACFRHEHLDKKGEAI